MYIRKGNPKKKKYTYMSGPLGSSSADIIRETTLIEKMQQTFIKVTKYKKLSVMRSNNQKCSADQ